MDDLKDKVPIKPPADYYRYCFVPSCKNTSVTAPGKQYVFVPVKEEKRRAWMLAAGYPPDRKLITGSRVCCEDHLDLKNDIENWREIQFHGGGSRRLRDGVLPRFNIAKPEYLTNDTTDIGIDIKHENIDTMNDVDVKNSEYNVDNLSTTGFAFVSVGLDGVDVCDPQVNPAAKRTCEKWTQTEEKEYESKHVQVKPDTRVKIIQTLKTKSDKGV